jgi:two-component system, cell cycle sensor histidine kinase and response regulator CckA
MQSWRSPQRRKARKGTQDNIYKQYLRDSLRSLRLRGEHPVKSASNTRKMKRSHAIQLYNASTGRVCLGIKLLAPSIGLTLAGFMRPFSFPLRFRVWILILVVCSTACPVIAQQSKTQSDNRQVLTVSASIDHYPYSFRNRSGQLTGYAVDLLDAVAEAMKVKLQRLEVSPEQDIANLQQGRCDIGQFHAPVPGGIKVAEFSQPVLINYGEIFVRKGAYHFRNIAELRLSRLKIAGPEQAVTYLAENGIDRSLLRQGTSPNCLKWLSKGDVDAVVLTRLTGLAQAQYLGLKNIEALGAEISGFKVSYSIATRAGDTELIGRINEALATLSVEGKTVEIYSKWFGRYEIKGLTQLQRFTIGVSSLFLALAVALWALQKQRQLQQRIAIQSAELRENEEILAEAQRFAHLGHWQFDLSGKGRSLWSAEAYRIFERDPSLGPPSIEMLIDYAIPSDRNRWRKAIESMIQNPEVSQMDLTIEPRPGVQKHIHEQVRPVMDGSQCVAWFGTVQDVTARRMAESALRRSEQLLRALYANLPIGLGAVENIGNEWAFMSINPSAVRQLSLPRCPAPGCRLEDSGLAAESLEKWTDLFIRGSSATEPLSVEINDRRSVQSVTVVPLDPADGRQRCFFLLEDVTEKKRQNDEIAQGRRLRAIGELVGGIAHEFNNLLTPIAISSELLMADWERYPDLNAGIKVIADAAKRSADLTRRLLSFGRKSEQHSARIELGEIVEANLQLIKHTIDRRIAIQSFMPENLPPLFLDSSDLHQILLNLLVNARDTLTEKLKLHSRDSWHPLLRIEAALRPPDAAAPFDSSQLPAALTGWVQLTVKDNGQGMPPNVIERLFEPFYTTKETGMGTGLGLATSWHLVAGFGGRIDVESTIGEGSVFHVWIPVEPVPAIDLQKPQPHFKEHDAIIRSFLLVEDEPAVAGVVEAMLRRRNHQVTRASDGNEAWAMLSSRPDAFDAVIMDLNMPGMNGLDLAQCARDADYEYPLIVMSGRITEDEQAALARLGVVDIICKPFSISQLEETITQAFARIPLRS